MCTAGVQARKLSDSQFVSCKCLFAIVVVTGVSAFFQHNNKYAYSKISINIKLYVQFCYSCFG